MEKILCWQPRFQAAPGLGKVICAGASLEKITAMLAPRLGKLTIALMGKSTAGHAKAWESRVQLESAEQMLRKAQLQEA